MKAAVLVTLFATAGAVPAARACRYCQQAADPVEVMRFQGQGRNAGSFPLDDSLNNFANGAPATPATAAAPVVTRAAELPPHPAGGSGSRCRPHLAADRIHGGTSCRRGSAAGGCGGRDARPFGTLGRPRVTRTARRGRVFRLAHARRDQPADRDGVGGWSDAAGTPHRF